MLGAAVLLRFQVTNHASLRDEQELSLVATDRHDDRAEGEVTGGGHRVVPVAAIYGTNASGKSNVIDAMGWMRAAVLSSFRRWDPSGGVPRRPFALRDSPSSFPSTFVVDFALDGVRHEYGFSVDDVEVRQEWLYYYPEARARRLYERKRGEPVAFGRWLTGRRKVISELLRSNSLYLSVAAAQGHPQLSRVYRWFQSGMRMATDDDFASRLDHTVRLCLDGSTREDGGSVLTLLTYADLGVSGLRIEEPDEESRAAHERLTRAVREALGDKVRVAQARQDVLVEHRATGGTYRLGLGEESSGTRTWIGLVGPVITTLASGAVLCVDELDARLHPYLVDALVGMFQSPETNRTGAQLVFSTHEAGLLGRNARTEFYRDQVWFTEKDPESLATRLFPMTEFRVRDQSGENLEKRYLAGRYGAVPHLDDDLLRSLAAACRGGSAGGAGQAAEAEEGRAPGAA
ncbi:AAA family ATPase [Streptomyces chumphonensis]|uniref:AAA family ATPase n=1 Tax=Streptomyces chumphonensis TaxID=1214925 RepID=UPI003D741B28